MTPAEQRDSSASCTLPGGSRAAPARPVSRRGCGMPRGAVWGASGPARRVAWLAHGGCSASGAAAARSSRAMWLDVEQRLVLRPGPSVGALWPPFPQRPPGRCRCRVRRPRPLRGLIYPRSLESRATERAVPLDDPLPDAARRSGPCGRRGAPRYLGEAPFKGAATPPHLAVAGSATSEAP